MRNNRFIRNVVCTALAMSLIISVPVLASSRNMEDGYAYNNATYSGGMRRCNAGTVNNREGEYASVYLKATYFDGSEEEYWSRVEYGSVSITTNWDYVEDYYSIHRLHESNKTYVRGTTTLASD